MSTILIVDDERGVRESLNMLLSEAGHQTDYATNGREALNLLIQKNYDLVLTDIRMPEMNGLMLLKEIRDRWQEKIPVIVLSAYGTIQSAVNAVKEGASDFIIKPFEIDNLMEAVRAALAHRRNSLGPEEAAAQQARTGSLTPAVANHEVFELAVLHEIGKTINSTLEIKKIVSIALEMARQSVNADKARVLVYKADQDEASLDLSYCENPSLAQKDVLDQSVIEWVVQNGKPLLLEDTDKIRQFKNNGWGKYGIGSLMVVPFKRKTKLIGVMLLANQVGRAKFSEDDFRFIMTLANQVAVAIENAQLYEELQNHFTDTIRALITAVETKDSYTFGHSDRVTQYALMIARQMGFNQVELRRLEYLSLLHDIGKIGIEEKILRKPTKLTEQEWEIIKNHAALGGSIIKPIKFLQEGERIVRHHHEWFDGNGYPDGLKGNAIPLFSRIIAVADSFDAMTSMRPYRKSLGVRTALDELKRCSSKQFDPAIVDLFLNAFEERIHTQ